MIRTAVIGLAGLVRIVAGCNGDPPSATTAAVDGSKGSAAATKALAFTDSQLATALLTTTDLGGTWKVAPKSTATPKTSPSPATAATPQSDTGYAYLDRLIKNSDKGGADDFGGVLDRKSTSRSTRSARSYSKRSAHRARPMRRS